MSHIEEFVEQVIEQLDSEWDIDPIHSQKTDGEETSLTRKTDQLSVIIGTLNDIRTEKVYVQIPKEIYGVPDRPNQIGLTVDRDPKTVAQRIRENDPAES